MRCADAYTYWEESRVCQGMSLHAAQQGRNQRQHIFFVRGKYLPSSGGLQCYSVTSAIACFHLKPAHHAMLLQHYIATLLAGVHNLTDEIQCSIPTSIDWSTENGQPKEYT